MKAGNEDRWRMVYVEKPSRQRYEVRLMDVILLQAQVSSAKTYFARKSFINEPCGVNGVRKNVTRVFVPSRNNVSTATTLMHLCSL